jgi:hypothetical protein
MTKRVALFACQECGRNFYTTKSAERACNDGCPGCGGVDIDVAPYPFSSISHVPISLATGYFGEEKDPLAPGAPPARYDRIVRALNRASRASNACLEADNLTYTEGPVFEVFDNLHTAATELAEYSGPDRNSLLARLTYLGNGTARMMGDDGFCQHGLPDHMGCPLCPSSSDCPHGNPAGGPCGECDGHGRRVPLVGDRVRVLGSSVILTVDRSDGVYADLRFENGAPFGKVLYRNITVVEE